MRVAKSSSSAVRPKCSERKRNRVHPVLPVGSATTLWGRMSRQDRTPSLVSETRRPRTQLNNLRLFPNIQREPKLQGPRILVRICGCNHAGSIT